MAEMQHERTSDEEHSNLSGGNALRRPSHWREIGRNALKALCITLLILLIRVPIEKGATAELIRERAYDLMQRRLSTTVNPSLEVPVVVVDMNADAAHPDIPLTHQDPMNPDEWQTSRPALRNLIDRLVARHPKAIGIDIDFSPDFSDHTSDNPPKSRVTGFITPDDPEFFAYCRRQSVPIFLGIARTAAGQPHTWLGSEEDIPLAASLLIPKGQTRWMLLLTHSNAQKEPCVTLAARIADASRGKAEELLDWRRHVMERVTEGSPRSTLEVQASQVDYGPLERISESRVDSAHLLPIHPDIAKEPDWANSVVIVGEVTHPNPSDVFPISGRSEPKPGVLLHACFALTLIRTPLYQLKEIGRVGADLLLAFVILFAVSATHWLHVRRHQPNAENQAKEALEREWEKLERALHQVHQITVVAVAALAFVVGVLFVHRTRILWDDFPFVIAALFLDQPVERGIQKFFDRLRRTSEGSATEQEPTP